MITNLLLPKLVKLFVMFTVRLFYTSPMLYVIIAHSYCAHIANVGCVGLDMDEVFSREELLTSKKLSLDLINSPLPWLLEQVGFCVCEVHEGNNVTA